MLHEILLSLSGHPSPLLQLDEAEPRAFSGLTPPERQLLASASHLSHVHISLITYTAQVVSSHPSAICRAVAVAIQTVHLSAFQRKVLEVERGILKDDPEWVGAYNIVPLTAVMGEFKQWTRRMDWLWEMLQFMMKGGSSVGACHGAQIMNKLRSELQSGYQDVVDAASSLVTAAETAWLKQVSAWVLYGKLPAFGADDFFIQAASAAGEDYSLSPVFLPSFVTSATASSMLFIGRALNHARVKSSVESGLGGLSYMSSNMKQLGSLAFPLNGASLARSITAIRLSLAENTLQKILPLTRVIATLQLFRDFFLLGRGEFAMALTQEADEKIRNRWRRAGNLAHERDAGMKNVTVKDGEVSAVLARTWAVLISMQGQHGDDDEQLEQARELLNLQLLTSNPMTPISTGRGLDGEAAELLSTSPFRNLLFSVPAMLSIQLPSPLDMIISPSDLQLYSSINAYLQSIRRAHIRITDLWKLTSLRRHHPAPRGGEEYAAELRQRWNARSVSMRGSWTTASATAFFLAETEAFMQMGIVSELWEGFSSWLIPGQNERRGWRSGATTPATRPTTRDRTTIDFEDYSEGGFNQSTSESNEFAQSRPQPLHDPQTISTAHTLYLRTLVHRLLLTQPRFSQSLYSLLIHIDHFVAHIRRLHSIFVSLDLENDAGVVDAFVDLEKEEREVMALLRGVEKKVKDGVQEVIAVLHGLETDADFLAEWQGEGGASHDEDDAGGHQAYVPARVGGIDRLLMKLDFGSWFGREADWSGSG